MKVAIIGSGAIGSSRIEDCLNRGRDVVVYDPAPKVSINGVTYEQSLSEAVRGADVLEFCIPLDIAQAAFEESLPHAKKGVFIVDHFSRKLPVYAMLESFRDEFDFKHLGAHILCNPVKSDMSQQRFALINNGDDIVSWGQEYFKDISHYMKVIESAFEHDRKTSNTQVGTSVLNLSIASGFALVNCFPQLHDSYNNALDNCKFSLSMRGASMNPHVFRNIQFGHEMGKALAEKLLESERELFGWYLFDHDRYKQAIERVKSEQYKSTSRRESLLSHEDMSQFGELTTLNGVNSHYSWFSHLYGLTQCGVNIFEDLDATTAMNSAIVCLMDYVLLHDTLFEQSVTASLHQGLRRHDLVYHTQYGDWLTHLVNDSVTGYTNQHNRMTSELEKKLPGVTVVDDKKIVDLAAKRLFAEYG